MGLRVKIIIGNRIKVFVAQFQYDSLSDPCMTLRYDTVWRLIYSWERFLTHFMLFSISRFRHVSIQGDGLHLGKHINDCIRQSFRRYRGGATENCSMMLKNRFAARVSSMFSHAYCTYVGAVSVIAC